jgi:hypothetical protein
MVHALRKTRRLLNPEGILLNIHDVPQPDRIEIHSEGLERYAGMLMSHTDFESQKLADQALDQVVSEGLYSKDDVQTFEYLIHADTLEALQKHMEETWDTEYIPQNTIDKMIELMEEAVGEAEIIIRIPSRITRLLPT